MKINLLTIFATLFLSLFFVFTISAQTGNISNKNEKEYEKQKGDEALKIIKKTSPSGKVFSKCFKEDSRRTSLFIRLKVTFHASGKVTEVEIVEPSGCDYFDEDAIKVAKKIKFKPEIKDGESVTVTKVIAYSSAIV